MAEKHVSVRLAAVGGKQVCAELTGIGDADKKGFGKASREMEIANAKLAKFARRAKIAVGVMVAAAAAAGITVVRSSLQTIDEQAKLAASLRTTTESLQELARAANHNTSLYVTYYADADIVPQFAGFVGAGCAAPVLADMTLAQAPIEAAIGVHVVEEWLSGLTGASVTSTITIPDRAIALAVSTRTVTAITGATSYDCGIAGTPAKFGDTLRVAAGSTNIGVIGRQAFYAPTPMLLTANGGSFTGGDVRIAIQYLLLTSPAA